VKKNYTIGDTELEDSGPKSKSKSEFESNNFKEISLVSGSQASSFQPKNKNYNPFESQITEIDSMLADF